MNNKFLRQTVVTVVAVMMAVGVVLAQENMKASLPVVISAATPLYPIGPHTANIQGTVRLNITTDGHRVVGADVKDDGGNPALGRAARENVLTWQFSNHTPLSFEVTYRYILVDKLDDIESNAPNSKVVIRFPTSVEVYARRWPGSIDVPMELKRDKPHSGASALHESGHAAGTKP